MKNSFGGYSGRCTGRLMNVLNEYTQLHIVESMCFASNGDLLYGNKEKPVGTYMWEGTTDFPVFNFTDPGFTNINENQKQRIDDIRKQASVRDLLAEARELNKELIEELQKISLSIQAGYDIVDPMPFLRKCEKEMRQKIQGFKHRAYRIF